MCPVSTTDASSVPEWTLGERLAKARSRAKVTKEEMGDILGIAPRTVLRYEADRSALRDGPLRLWAMRCNVPYEWLKSGQGPRGACAGSDVGPTNWYRTNTPERHSAAISAA